MRKRKNKNREKGLTYKSFFVIIHICYGENINSHILPPKESLGGKVHKEV